MKYYSNKNKNIHVFVVIAKCPNLTRKFKLTRNESIVN